MCGIHHDHGTDEAGHQEWEWHRPRMPHLQAVYHELGCSLAELAEQLKPRTEEPSKHRA